MVFLGLRIFGRTLANDTKLSSFVRGVFFPTPHAHDHQLLGLRFLPAAGLGFEKHSSHLGSVAIGGRNKLHHKRYLRGQMLILIDGTYSRSKNSPVNANDAFSKYLLSALLLKYFWENISSNH